ncbi:MAG: hypothetical protein Fur0010_25930 [Bdellovibrio sp.]
MHNEIVSYLNGKVSGANATAHMAELGDSSIYVEASKLHEVCLALRNSQWDFNVLQVITGTDYSDRIEVSYILASFTNNHELILKVKLDRENPEVDSVVDVWKAANFQERECFDMLGVNFKNHPDLRRVLCPEDWQGYPLRKDYVVQEKYLDMTVNPAHKINTGDFFFYKEIQQKMGDPKKVAFSWKGEGDSETAEA